MTQPYSAYTTPNAAPSGGIYNPMAPAQSAPIANQASPATPQGLYAFSQGGNTATFSAPSYTPGQNGNPGTWSASYNNLTGTSPGGQVGYQQGAQQANQRYSIVNDPNYNAFVQQSTNAQNAELYGQNVLNNSGVQQAANVQAGLVGPSSAQNAGIAAQQQGLSQLQATANGQGPNVAGMQSQQAVSQALQAQLAGAASAKGGAYAQAGAQRQAALNSAGIQGQAAGTAASTAAQQQLGAEQAYSSAAQGLSQQATGIQATSGQNAAGAASTLAGQENTGLNYYNQLANLYQGEGNTAANLASNQVANDYGLAGTQLQASTQQNIATQQQQTQLLGAGMGGAAGLMALLSTGAAEAGARGARDAGLSKEHAAKIGAMIGQHVGAERLGGKVPEVAAKADTEAAAKAAQGKPRGMSHDDMRGHLASLRKRIPASAQYEPAAPHAYQAGSALARLAKLRGAA